MCIQNIPEEPKKPELYCRTCGKVVSIDVASLICYGALHDLIEDDGNLFTREPK